MKNANLDPGLGTWQQIVARNAVALGALLSQIASFEAKQAVSPTPKRAARIEARKEELAELEAEFRRTKRMPSPAQIEEARIEADKRGEMTRREMAENE
jgi:hypothetical protein